MFLVGVDIVAYEDVSFCTQYVSCENILKYGTPMWNTLYMNLSFPFQKLPVTETVTKFHVSMTVLVFIIIIIQGDYCTKFHVSMTVPVFIILIIQGDYCTKFHISMTFPVFIIIIIQGEYCTKFHVSMTVSVFIIIIIQGDYCTFILM